MADLSNLRIRAYRSGDRPRLQEIRAAAFAPVFASLRGLLGPEIARVAMASAETEQATLLDQLCAEADDGRLLVAELDQTVVGFAAVALDAATGMGELGLNAVDPDRQRQGVASALYAAALDAMRDAGMRVAAVSTGLDAAHAPARAAYARAGFTRGAPSIWLCRAL